MSAKNPQGFQYLKFLPPVTTGDSWHRQEVGRSTGLIIRKGMRRHYRVRLMLGQSSVREWEGELYDGLELVAVYDAIEWQFGDTSSAPAAPEVEAVVVQLKTALWAATEPHPSIQSTRLAYATNGTTTTVGAGLAVALIDDATDTLYTPDDAFPHDFYRRKARDNWLSGFIATGGATFNVWLLAYGNAANPTGLEPRVIDTWAARAFTPPASVHSDATQWAWTCGQQNNLGSIVQGGIRWPQGGGALYVENPGGGDISISACLAFSSHY